MPFEDATTNNVELFNEVCIYASLLVTTTFTNSAVAMEFRDDMGWTIIGISGLNIFGNISVVFFMSSIDLYKQCRDSREEAHQQDMIRDKLGNRELF